MKAKFALPIAAFVIAIVGAFSTFASKSLVDIVPNEYKPGLTCVACAAPAGRTYECNTTTTENKCTCIINDDDDEDIARTTEAGACLILYRQ